MAVVRCVAWNSGRHLLKRTILRRPCLTPPSSSLKLRCFISTTPAGDTVQSVQSSGSDEGANGLLAATAPGMLILDFHRPQAMNALNAEMVEESLQLVRTAQDKEGDTRMIVLRGTGDRRFFVGSDMLFLHNCAAERQGCTRAMGDEFFRQQYTLNHALATSRAPVVSMWDGMVMGGGVGISVHGKFRIATENTFFAMSETGLGFFPDMGSSFFLPRLRSQALGKYIGLTSPRLVGRDVLAAGVATHYIEQGQFEALEGLLITFGQNASAASKDIDCKVLSQALNMLGRLKAGPDLAEAVGAPKGDVPADNHPPSYLEVYADEIDYCFESYSVDEILARVSELAVQHEAAIAPGQVHWSIRARRELELASPTSLAVTSEMLRRGADLPNLASCLGMEYRVAQRFLRCPDMVNGIRAVVAKVQERQWMPKPNENEVDEFFRVPPDGGELLLEGGIINMGA